ncbi:formyltransferase family protein [Candidatus Pelagibacter sp. HIMB1495]|uniref:formyltransferase family protein n=1 Tax=unclassified Candidatus Pelagibacter TaxID=2647897 RepID=UPI003F8301FD
MIENNKFFLKNFSNVVIFGHPQPEIIQINRKLKLSTTVITSVDQSKLMDKKLINYKVFNSIDNKCLNYLKNKFDFKKTLFIGIGPRYIFKKETIKLFEKNFINIHNSRLPLDAGGGAGSWTIMREDRISNMCIHMMTEDIDGGQIIANELSLYPKNCIIPSDLKKHSAKLMIKFYEKFMKQLLKKGEFELKPQIHYLSRYNPRLNTEVSGFIDWSLNSYDLINFINAFEDPYKGASTYLNNGNFGKLYLKKVQLHGGDTPNHPYMSGIVSRHDKNWIVVCTSSKHMLLVEEVINSDGENIISKIKIGDRFFTPYEKLNNAKSKRIYYNSYGLKK